MYLISECSIEGIEWENQKYNVLWTEIFKVKSSVDKTLYFWYYLLIKYKKKKKNKITSILTWILFLDIQFKHYVFPTKIEIYETYNPGAVVRILALLKDKTYNNKQRLVYCR